MDIDNANEWVAKFRQGSTEALQSLFHLCFTPACCFANTFVGDIKETEKLVSDLFVKLWEQREQVIDIDYLKSFLYVEAWKAAHTYIAALDSPTREQRMFLKLARTEEGEHYFYKTVMNIEVITLSKVSHPASGFNARVERLSQSVVPFPQSVSLKDNITRSELIKMLKISEAQLQ